MRKILRLLIPAFVAVAFFTSCEDSMDEIVVKEEVSIENTNKEGAMPPKDRIVNPYKR